MKNLNDELRDMGFKQKLESSLELGFRDALKNEEFKELVEKINLPKKKLISYTSEIMDSAKECSNCKCCTNILGCKNKIMGYAYTPKVDEFDNLYFAYEACKYKKKMENENKYLNNVYTINEPKEIRQASMKDIITTDKNRYETIKYLTKFIKNYQKDKNQKGLYLHGNFGCGKTYLIAAAFNELAKEGVKSAIIFWPEFLVDLKGSFGSSFNEKMDYIKKVPLLLIDDIGAENTTSWGRDEIFCPIVQYRMQEKLPTFFTSNLDIKSLELHFAVNKDNASYIKARRIIERVKQLTSDIEIISENLRK